MAPVALLNDAAAMPHFQILVFHPKLNLRIIEIAHHENQHAYTSEETLHSSCPSHCDLQTTKTPQA
eukprot:10866329-Karenia_brevis.AAC.1